MHMVNQRGAHALYGKLRRAELIPFAQDWGNSEAESGRSAFAFVGSANTEREIGQFQESMARLGPAPSALLAPSEVVSGDDLPIDWARGFWECGILLGNSVATSWNIYIRSGIHLMRQGRHVRRYAARSIAPASERAKPDVSRNKKGTSRTFATGNSTGPTHALVGGDGGSWLSTNSLFEPLTLKEIRSRSDGWHCVALKLVMKSLTWYVASIGRRDFVVTHSTAEDAMWRSNPYMSRCHILREIINGLGETLVEFIYTVRDHPCETGGCDTALVSNRKEFTSKISLGRYRL